MQKHKTNVEVITSLMEFSKFGPLTQVFIIDALAKHADAVASAAPEQLENGLISAEVWQSVAREIKLVLDDHLKG